MMPKTSQAAADQKSCSILGSQYTSLVYNERLSEYWIKPYTGSVDDSCDNILAKAVNGLYKTELIYSLTSRSCAQVERATLNSLHRLNNTHLHEVLGYTTPEEIITSYNQHLPAQLLPV